MDASDERAQALPTTPTMPHAFSFWGTGLALVGYRRVATGRYEVMRWLSILFVPVLPLSTWLIEPVGAEGVNLGAVVGTKFRYRVLGRGRTSVRRVLELYAQIVATVVVALAPIALVWSRKPSGPPGWPFTIGFFASIVWPVVVLGWLDNRTHRVFERAA